MSFGKETIGRKEREGERERREFIGETNDISTYPIGTHHVFLKKICWESFDKMANNGPY